MNYFMVLLLVFPRKTSIVQLTSLIRLRSVRNTGAESKTQASYIFVVRFLKSRIVQSSRRAIWNGQEDVDNS